MEHWMFGMALLTRIHPISFQTVLFCPIQQTQPMAPPPIFVDNMLYVGSKDSIKKQFEDSVNNCFYVKFLGPAQWFLQMHIHQHQDSTYTLDQINTFTF
jgi:hypothetical protein